MAGSAILRRARLRHYPGMMLPKPARLAALTALAALVPAAARADAVRDLVTAEMARSMTPGIAIAVVGPDGTGRVEGFGQANIEHAVPVHADTLFKTGAVGMQFTAAAIMLLAEDGKIDLDAPVSRYLRQAPVKWARVTVRQLLTHTSGLPATPNGDFRADYTNDQLLALIGAQDLNFPAGSRWRFSYAGYIVLGFVIEAVTGEHWSKFMARRLFMPLGMTSARGIEELRIIPNRAAGYEVRDGALRNAEWISQTANSTADGSVYVSALDYAAWAEALAARRLLAPGSWTAMAGSARLADGSVCAYVPGWAVGGAPGRTMWTQQGSWQGFQSYSLRFPDRNLTVAVFANGEQADVGRLARAVAGQVDAEVALPPAAPLANADAAQTARVRAWLAAIAGGRARPQDFADYAKLDFTELTQLHAGTLAGLGALEDLALFARSKSCGSDQLRYRARYAKGLVDVRLALTSDGRIADLDIAPLTAWDDPL